MLKKLKVPIQSLYDPLNNPTHINTNDPNTLNILRRVSLPGSTNVFIRDGGQMMIIMGFVLSSSLGRGGAYDGRGKGRNKSNMKALSPESQILRH